MSRKAAKKEIKKFTIDCSVPVEDNILDPASFQKFLTDRIKVGGKPTFRRQGQISRDKPRLKLKPKLHPPNATLKYLTKKYLKQQQLRTFLHRHCKSTASTSANCVINISNQDDAVDEGVGAESADAVLVGHECERYVEEGVTGGLEYDEPTVENAATSESLPSLHGA